MTLNTTCYTIHWHCLLHDTTNIDTEYYMTHKTFTLKTTWHTKHLYCILHDTLNIDIEYCMTHQTSTLNTTWHNKHWYWMLPDTLNINTEMAWHTKHWHRILYTHQTLTLNTAWHTKQSQEKVAKLCNWSSVWHIYVVSHRQTQNKQCHWGSVHITKNNCVRHVPWIFL